MSDRCQMPTTTAEILEGPLVYHCVSLAIQTYSQTTVIYLTVVCTTEKEIPLNYSSGTSLVYSLHIACSQMSHYVSEPGETKHYPFECPDNYFKCPGNYCIPFHYVCDGNWQCPDGQDEIECSKYSISCTAGLSWLPAYNSTAAVGLKL